MARVHKSYTALEQGYTHRDHRSSKSKNKGSRVDVRKRLCYKEKIRERNELELGLDKKSIKKLNETL
jgi:hypothetical protein